MASDPALREEVYKAVPPGVVVRADDLRGLRTELGMDCTTTKLRRAVEALHYGYGMLTVVRTTNTKDWEDDSRGWEVRRRHGVVA